MEAGHERTTVGKVACGGGEWARWLDLETEVSVIRPLLLNPEVSATGRRQLINPYINRPRDISIQASKFWLCTDMYRYFLEK